MNFSYQPLKCFIRMQYNQRGTKFSHIYAHQSINLFLYVIKLMPLKTSCACMEKTGQPCFPNLSKFCTSSFTFCFFRSFVIASFNQRSQNKIIEHPLKTTTKSKNISIARGQFLISYLLYYKKNV